MTKPTETEMIRYLEETRTMGAIEQARHMRQHWDIYEETEGDYPGEIDPAKASPPSTKPDDRPTYDEFEAYVWRHSPKAWRDSRLSDLLDDIRTDYGSEIFCKEDL